MSRRNLRRAQPTSLRQAIEMCKDYAREAHNLSVERIAEIMDEDSSWAIYGWLRDGSIPGRKIMGYQSACRCDFITRWLAHANGQLLINAVLRGAEGVPLENTVRGDNHLKDLAMEWTATANKNPKKGQTVLAFWTPKVGPVHPGCFAVATYYPGHWCNPEDDEDDYASPTHWMPLPEAPNIPRGRLPEGEDIKRLQAILNEAVGALLDFATGRADAEAVGGHLSTALEGLAWHRENVQRAGQPELDLEGADHA